MYYVRTRGGTETGGNFAISSPSNINNYRQYISSGVNNFLTTVDVDILLPHCYSPGSYSNGSPGGNAVVGPRWSSMEFRQYIIEIVNYENDMNSGHAVFKLEFNGGLADNVIDVTNLTDFNFRYGTAEMSQGYVGLSSSNIIAQGIVLNNNILSLPNYPCPTSPGTVNLTDRTIGCIADISRLYVGMTVLGDTVGINTRVINLVYDQATYGPPANLINWYNAGVSVPGAVTVDKSVSFIPGSANDESVAIIDITFVDTENRYAALNLNISGTNFDTFGGLRCNRPHWTDSYLLLTQGVDELTDNYRDTTVTEVNPFDDRPKWTDSPFTAICGVGAILLDTTPFYVPYSDSQVNEWYQYYSTLLNSLGYLPQCIGSKGYMHQQNSQDFMWFLTSTFWHRGNLLHPAGKYMVRPTMKHDYINRRGTDNPMSKVFGQYTKGFNKECARIDPALQIPVDAYSFSKELLPTSPYNTFFNNYPYDKRAFAALIASDQFGGVWLPTVGPAEIDNASATTANGAKPYYYNFIHPDTCRGFYRGNAGYVQLLVTCSGKLPLGTGVPSREVPVAGVPGLTLSFGGAATNWLDVENKGHVNPDDTNINTASATLYLDNRHTNRIRPSEPENVVIQRNGASDTCYYFEDITEHLDEGIPTECGINGLVIRSKIKDLGADVTLGNGGNPCYGAIPAVDLNYERRDTINSDHASSDLDLGSPGPYCHPVGDRRIINFAIDDGIAVSGGLSKNYRVRTFDYCSSDDPFACCENCHCSPFQAGNTLFDGNHPPIGTAGTNHGIINPFGSQAFDFFKKLGFHNGGATSDADIQSLQFGQIASLDTTWEGSDYLSDVSFDDHIAKAVFSSSQENCSLTINTMASVLYYYNIWPYGGHVTFMQSTIAFFGSGNCCSRPASVTCPTFIAEIFNEYGDVGNVAGQVKISCTASSSQGGSFIVNSNATVTSQEHTDDPIFGGIYEPTAVFPEAYFAGTPPLDNTSFNPDGTIAVVGDIWQARLDAAMALFGGCNGSAVGAQSTFVCPTTNLESQTFSCIGDTSFSLTLEFRKAFFQPSHFYLSYNSINYYDIEPGIDIIDFHTGFGLDDGTICLEDSYVGSWPAKASSAGSVVALPTRNAIECNSGLCRLPSAGENVLARFLE